MVASEHQTKPVTLQESLPSSHKPLPEGLKETLRLREEPVLRTAGFMGLQADTAASTLLEAAEARATVLLSSAEKRIALKQALADVDSLKAILQQARLPSRGAPLLGLPAPLHLCSTAILSSTMMLSHRGQHQDYMLCMCMM